jgi:hypothetical protein
MQTMRESWTDERLDDLSKRVDSGFREAKAETGTGFASVRVEISGVREDMRTEFASVRTEIVGVREEIGGVRSEIASLQRTLLIGFSGMIASVIGGIAAAVVAHAP